MGTTSTVKSKQTSLSSVTETTCNLAQNPSAPKCILLQDIDPAAGLTGHTILTNPDLIASMSARFNFSY